MARPASITREEDHKRYYCRPLLDYTALVPGTTTTLQGTTHGISLQSADPTSQTPRTSQTSVQNIGLQTVTDQYKLKGFNESVIDTMLQAKSAKTYQQYSTYWSRWEKYCQDQNYDALKPPIGPVVNFLQNCRDEFELGY